MTLFFLNIIRNQMKKNLFRYLILKSQGWMTHSVPSLFSWTTNTSNWTRSTNTVWCYVSQIMKNILPTILYQISRVHLLFSTSYSLYIVLGGTLIQS